MAAFNKSNKICRNCGSVFSGFRNEILCSEQCYLDYHSKNAEKNNEYTKDKCREWTGNLNCGGYGKFSFKRLNVTAHRKSFELNKGPIPQDKNVIRHLCHNPKCIKPEHLECGTYQDNHDDQKKAGRTLLGEKHPSCVISDADAQYIRDNPNESYNSLRKKFRISNTTIWKIKKNKR